MELFIDFHFHLIEALTIDTDDAALADKGVWVGEFDDAKDGGAFKFLGQDAEHFHILSCVPAVPIEDGYAVTSLRSDGFGQLLILA